MFWNRRWFRRGALLAAFPLAAGGCHGRHHGHHGMSEADMKEHARDAAEMVLDHVDATDDQEARVSAIIDQLVPDLVALRPEREALLKELRTELGQPQVDPDRIEEIRQKALDLADRASARAAQALIAGAAVLDQQQRAKLVKRWERRHRS